MAEFICRLGTPSGEVMTRMVEATGAGEAKSLLEEEGFRVFAVSNAEKGLSAALSIGGAGRKNQVKPGDFLLFNQQLSALLRAGIPVLQSINLLKNRSGSSTLRVMLADIEDKIKSGVSLSEAFESQGTFPKIYTASLLAGEKSGALDDVLARYVDYLKRNVGVARKLRGALAYPLFLLAAASFMVAFLTLYIVPRMSELFKGLGNKGLPTVTIVVLAFSNFVAGNFFWLLPLVLVLVFALVIWLRSPGGKLILHKFLLRLPVVGNLIKQMTTAQLARSLSTLLSGGITVPDAWNIASESITNLELRRRSQAVLALIREGRGFTEALNKANWLPELALDMVGIGEKSGSLREMLDEVANFYDAEAEVRLEQLTSLLEPVILVFMAGIVITILLAIYLPIIQTISSGPFSGKK